MTRKGAARGHPDEASRRSRFFSWEQILTMAASCFEIMENIADVLTSGLDG